MQKAKAVTFECAVIERMWTKLYELYISIRNLLFDTALIILLHTKNQPDKKKWILIIRLDAIGDFVLWLDAATAIRKLYPQEEYNLVLLGNILWKELAENSPLFDETIFIDNNLFYFNLQYRWNIWKIIRSFKWTLAINPTFSRKFGCSDSAVRMSGATFRIGSKGDLSNQLRLQKLISNRWYTKLLPATENTLMELERNAEFVRNLGIADFKLGIPRLVIKDKLPIDFNEKNYVVIAPGASLPVKQWPIERFAELGKQIYKRFGVKIIICGSMNETVLAQKMLDSVESVSTLWIEDWTGKTSLIELASVIKGAKMLIGNDSSAVHIAAAVGTPSICIVGGWHFGRFMPYAHEGEGAGGLPIAVFEKLDCYQCNLKCINIADNRTASKCIASISVGVVMNRVLESNILSAAIDR